MFARSPSRTSASKSAAASAWLPSSASLVARCRVPNVGDGTTPAAKACLPASAISRQSVEFDFESATVELEYLRSVPNNDPDRDETVLCLMINGAIAAMLDRHHAEALACALFAQLARRRGDQALGDHLAAVASRMTTRGTTGCLDALQAMLPAAAYSPLAAAA